MPRAAMSNVDRVYAQLKQMAINYDFRPRERLNEVELAAHLQTSRTPLREALNRLFTEGFLTFADKPGFYCRALTAGEVNDLYECRIAIEKQAALLAAERASDEGLTELQTLVPASAHDIETPSAQQLLLQDEAFHIRIAELSGNQELRAMLANINERIHFIRSIERERRRKRVEVEHRVIARALKEREGQQAARLLERHIHRRMDDIVDAIRIGVSRIYMRDEHR